MATSRMTQRPLIFQNENSGIQGKKAIVSGKTNGSETAKKKGGVGRGGRKALNDITNKSSTTQEASSRKKNIPEQELNEAEAFLHDHKKCIKAQQAMMNTFDLDLVLPGHDSVNTAERPQSKEGKTDSHRFDLIEQEDLLMSEISDWTEVSTQRKSPPYSPIGQDALPSSPVACESKDVEFVLKQENDLR